MLQWSLAGADEDLGIARAAAAAARADVVVLLVGESDSTVGEGLDSADMRLPGRQNDLVSAVAATGTPLVSVLVHGRPLAVPELKAASAAVVSHQFAGQAQGEALARVLVGEASPAGRVAISWPASVGSLPVFYNFKPSTRIGCYFQSPRSEHCGAQAPLWRFGEGLSYTSFAYSDVSLSAPTVGATDVLQINATVTNVGAVASDEVAQLYVRDVLASVTQPLLQLKGFERLHAIAPGASRIVSFELLPERDLYIIARNYSRIVEPGAFTFFVGGASTAQAAGAAGGCVNGSFAVTTPGGGAFSVRMGPLEAVW